MPTKRLLVLAGLSVLHASQAKADSPACFVPVQVAPQGHTEYTLPVTLEIGTKGQYDLASQSLFGNKDHWSVYYKTSDATTWTSLSVADINPKPPAGVIRTSPTLLVIMAKDPGIKKDGRDLDWTVTVTGLDPNCNSGSSALSLPYPTPGTKLPSQNSFFNPVLASQGQTASVSLTGSFSAGGGAKPVYAIKEIGNISPTERWRAWTMLPIFTSEVDINQSVKAGSEPAGYRSRIDPDSISVGGALWRAFNLHSQHGGQSTTGTQIAPKFRSYSPWSLYSVTTHLQLADFEFARTDPSSAYTGGFGIQPVFTPWQKTNGNVVLNRDLYFGLEAGQNLNKPSTLDGVAVDLSHYNTILRGVTGADVNFAVLSGDSSVTVFSAGATYRVRIPAFDEPFVTDFHQTKAAGLSTKARNWVDVTLGYNPFKWQYFSFTTEYKYGSLPPVFNLVNHSVTVGITFSALQSSLAKFQ